MMRHGAHIRTGLPGDAGRLAVLASQVWLHTYATEGVSEDIAQHVLSELTVEKFASALHAPQTCVLVAESGGNLVGFAALRFGASCPTGSSAVAELQTLYVQAHFLGRGIGKSLLQAAQARAREQADAPLWLTFHAKNARAMSFYARQGYCKLGTMHFVLGQGRHENHVLVGPGASALDQAD